ncbi:hypothetical protein H1R16_03970 [Marnyiella aurantia]|uniref:Right-handed parallel beta-helix repeat-containing protein n=1 Tax=Marnyiella aurantia TaxID=2758037 RepID=A0A7D7RLJ1_9FLAO|nr:hypothetical protein [Marnyiella aurantia]QMS99172.1 hypothetical protein H1R16_03970 [Marnyiella aurantia]
MIFRYILIILLLGTQGYDSQVDNTPYIQNLINQARKGSVIDGQNKTYYVTSLWLKSDIELKNFVLYAIPTQESDVSVISIGNDLHTNKYNRSTEAQEAFVASQTYPGIQNIVLDNIIIDGNRALQPALEVRDGGKHGISIKGFSNNITIKNVTARNCVTDGIALYRGLHTTLDRGVEVFAIRNIRIDNFQAFNNRRHGGSGDSIENFRCTNSRFENNGLDVWGKFSGAKPAVFNGNVYGNGWIMEGYGLGSGIRNIIFDQCSFISNAASGLLFYDVANSSDRNFIFRDKIKILNSTLDSGVQNPTGDFGLIFTSNIENKKNHMKLYNQVLVSNTTITGKILLRSVQNVHLLDVNIITRDETHGLLDYADNVSYLFTTNKKTIFTWEHYNGKNIQ